MSRNDGWRLMQFQDISGAREHDRPVGKCCRFAVFPGAIALKREHVRLVPEADAQFSDLMMPAFRQVSIIRLVGERCKLQVGLQERQQYIN